MGESDIHYIWVFVIIFGLLGILSPLINAEFGSDLDENNSASGLIDEGALSESSLTIWQVIFNFLLMPFWTFGLPAWVNLWIMPFLRIPFIVVIVRNIWVGGGG